MKMIWGEVPQLWLLFFLGTWGASVVAKTGKNRARWLIERLTTKGG